MEFPREIFTLRFIASRNKPVFQAVVRDGLDNASENLRLLHRCGWIEVRGDGFVVTESGRKELRAVNLQPAYCH